MLGRLVKKKIGHRLILSPVKTRQDAPLRDRVLPILKYANENVSFYEGGFDRFLNENSLVSDEAFRRNFAKLPLSTKTDLRKDNDAFLSQRLDNTTQLLKNGTIPKAGAALWHVFIKRNFSVPISTGGSSGVPSFRWLDHEDGNAMAQSFLESFRRNGWKDGDNFIVFYPLQSYFTDSYAHFSSLLNMLFGFTMVPFTHITTNSVHRLLDSLKKHKPSLLVIFPCVLQRVAEIMREENIPPVRGLKYINLSGEFLMDCSKSFIQEYFPDSDIQTTYGAVEFGEIAHQSGPKSSYDYDVFPEFAYVEQGEENSLIVTALQQTAFPMIRYVMDDRGDVITRSDGSQKILNLDGRHSDYISSLHGERFYPSSLNTLINDTNAAFKHESPPIIHAMIRYEDDSVHLHCILREKDHSKSNEVMVFLLKELENALGSDYRYKVHLPDHFDHDYTRKFKIIGEGDGLSEVVGGYYKQAS